MAENSEKSCRWEGQCTARSSARVAVASLIIKEKLTLSDEETVEQIRENPYLQYFLGYETS